MFKKETEEAAIPGTEASKRMTALAEEIFNKMDSGEHFIGL